MGEVVRRRHEAELPVDVAAIECAAPDGVEADPVDNLSRFVGVGDVWDDDPGRVHLERLDVVAVASLGDAHQRVDVVNAGGSDLVFQTDPSVRHVLGAQPYSVDTAKASDLDDPRVG